MHFLGSIFLFLLASNQATFALGSLSLKQASLFYKQGKGTASFDKLSLELGDLSSEINNLHQIDIDYKKSAYYFTQRFDNKVSALFKWNIVEETKILRDTKQDIIFKTRQPMDITLGTRFSRVNIPKLSFANNQTAIEVDRIALNCKHPHGKANPFHYLVNVVRACLVDGKLTIKSVISRQETENSPLISKEFDDILEKAKHPLATRTGINVDEHRTNIVDKQIIDQLDLKIVGGQAYFDMFVKVFSIPIRVELKGPIKLLNNSQRLRLHVESFKLLGVSFTDVFMKLVKETIKTYNTKLIKIEYPFIYLDINALYSEDH